MASKRDKERDVRQLIKDYMQTFASPEGLKVLASLSRFCGENRTCFARGDPYQTTYNEGARAVILHIRRMITEDLSQPRETHTVSE